MDTDTLTSKSFWKKGTVDMVSHSSTELSEIINYISDNVSTIHDQILFLSFTRSYVNMMKNIMLLPNLYDNIFIVDFVTKYIIDEIEDKNTVWYRKPPENLDKFKEIIIQLLHYSDNNIIVIDSLNQLFTIAEITNKSFDKFIDFLNDINTIDHGIQIKKILLFYNRKDSVFSDSMEKLNDKVIMKEI
jgi:hypothetical protein